MSVSYAASRTTPIFHAVSIIIWDCRQESINSLCQSEPCKKNFLMLYLVCYWNFFTGRIYMKRRINILCLIALLLSFVLPYTPATAKAPAMKRHLTLTVGQKTTLKISGGIIRKKSFKSSKKSIVSVTSKGKLTAKKAGQCKITATIQWKPKKSFRKFFKKKLYKACKCNMPFAQTASSWNTF